MKKFFKVFSAAMISTLLLAGCTANINIDDGDTINQSVDEDDSEKTDKDDKPENSGKDENNAENSDTNTEDGNGTANENGDTDNGAASGNNAGDDTQAAGGVLGTEAEKNGQYFVKIGERVYFRGYGADSFQNPCLWGEYMSCNNGGASAIYYYDEVTGDTVKAFDDNGYGRIVFADGLFYLNKKGNNGASSYVYVVNPDGKEVDKANRYDGQIVDYEDDVIIIENYSSSEDTIIGLYPNGGEAFSISSDKYTRYLGCYCDTIAYYEMSNDSKTINFYALTIGDESATYLGKATLSQGTEIAGYEPMNMEVAWFDRNVCGSFYFGIAYRSGTGNFFDGGMILEAYPWEADSAKMIENFSNGMYEEMPYLWLDEIGGYEVIENKPYSYQLVQNTNSNYDLFYQNYCGEREYVVADFADPWTYEEEFATLVLAENVDLYPNEIFAMRAIQIYDADAAIGWRDGYLAQKIEYVRIDKNTGKSQVILTLDYNKNYYGY